MIIADTGFFLAIANRADENHALAVATAARFDERLVTTWPVLTETCHLLMARLGVDAELAFVRALRDGAVDLFPMTIQHLVRADELMTKYHDLPMDLADASLVLLAEHLGSGRIFSTDRRDFHTYRWKNRKPFQNLLVA